MSRTAERQLPMENLGPGTPTPELQNAEIIKAPEKWNVHYGLLVISGPPGAGTTSLAKGLVELTGSSLYTVGLTVREMAGEDERAPDFVDRDPKVDALVDERVRQMVIHSDKTNPAIAEAQIGAITALDIQRSIMEQGLSQDDNPVIRILLTARKDVRDDRVYKDSRRKGDINHITGKLYTREEIRKRNTNRAKEDVEWWKGLYPNLIGDDHPHQLGARDAQGRKIYHLEFDNSDHTSPQETLMEVLNSLRELGLISPVEQEMEQGKAIPLTPTFAERIRGIWPGNKKRLAN